MTKYSCYRLNCCKRRTLTWQSIEKWLHVSIPFWTGGKTPTIR